ncbi:MAG: hypothetical protein HY673_05665 [Chloroflexi bacterium]|nr:hypothetical protein [Chloroflexota bacterium]
MALTIKLTKDKTTPGTVRFSEAGQEDHPINIYLSKARAKELGDPEAITITIEKA